MPKNKKAAADMGKMAANRGAKLALKEKIMTVMGANRPMPPVPAPTPDDPNLPSGTDNSLRGLVDSEKSNRDREMRETWAERNSYNHRDVYREVPEFVYADNIRDKYPLPGAELIAQISEKPYTDFQKNLDRIDKTYDEKQTRFAEGVMRQKNSPTYDYFSDPAFKDNDDWQEMLLKKLNGQYLKSDPRAR